MAETAMCWRVQSHELSVSESWIQGLRTAKEKYMLQKSKLEG